MITNIRVFNYHGANQFFDRVAGDIDITGADIDESLLFRPNLLRQSRQFYLPQESRLAYIIRYVPVVAYPTEIPAINALRQFVVRFNVTGSNMNNSNSPASITNPGFSILTPRLGASVLLESNSSHFYSLNTIGYLRAATGSLLPTYQYMIEKRNLKEYVFPNIPATYSTE